MQRIAEELGRVKDLLRQYPQGMSITEIAGKLGKNNHSVARYLDVLHASGHVDLRTFGMAKVYTLSSRVPLSALLSYTTDLVLVVDSSMRVIQINDPFLTLIGLEREKVILQEILYIPAPDTAMLAFLRVIGTQIRMNQDLDEINLDSEPKEHFHLRIIPTVFDDGSTGTTAILENITGERRALDEIRASRDFFRDIFSHITDGLFVYEDRDSGEEILFVNERLAEITGYSRGEIAAMDPTELVIPEDQERVRACFQAMAEQKSSMHDIWFWTVRKDRELRYLHVRMASSWYGGRFRYYILVTDMTEWCKKDEQEHSC